MQILLKNLLEVIAISDINAGVHETTRVDSTWPSISGGTALASVVTAYILLYVAYEFLTF
jgi:hypothetical protein